MSKQIIMTKRKVEHLNEIKDVVDYHLRMYGGGELSVSNMISDMMLIKNLVNEVL